MSDLDKLLQDYVKSTNNPRKSLGKYVINLNLKNSIYTY